MSTHCEAVRRVPPTCFKPRIACQESRLAPKIFCAWAVPTPSQSRVTSSPVRPNILVGCLYDVENTTESDLSGNVQQAHHFTISRFAVAPQKERCLG